MARFKKVLRLLSFILIFCLMLSGVSWIFAPKDNKKEAGLHNSAAMGFLAEEKNTIDIFFLGDSECYAGFSPMQMWEEYGFTAFSCGTPRQYIQDSQKYLKSFMENQKPKLLVLEANLMYRSDGSFSDFFRGLQNTLMKVVPIVEYHDRWKTLNAQDFKSSKGYTGRDELKGFKMGTAVKPYEKGAYMISSSAEEKIPQVNIYYFENILQYCRENGIEVMLVNSASPVNWNYEKHNGISALAKKHNINYVDMNLLVDEIGIDWKKDTYDAGDHVNFFGARKITSYIGKYIKENYEIPDHRNDPRYSKWNDDLKKYQEKVKKA